MQAGHGNRYRKAWPLALALLCAPAWAGTDEPPAAQAAPPVAPSGIVRCEADGMHRVHCPMDTSAGVHLVRQLSEASCIRNTDWGVDVAGVWVARGCRAEFAAPLQAGAVVRTVVRCESRGTPESCAVALRGAPVRLLRQTSALPCRFGESWGAGRNEVWVSRGCKGEFEVGDRDTGFPPGERLLVCESKSNRKRFCGTTIERGARLLRQISGKACEEGRSWGWEREGVWVDDGCRAQFAVE